MKLVDLKKGMVCELKNGSEIIIVRNDRYVYDKLEHVIYQLSRDYNDSLISIDSDYDIIKVSYGDKVLFERVSRYDVIKELTEMIDN